MVKAYELEVLKMQNKLRTMLLIQYNKILMLQLQPKKREKNNKRLEYWKTKN
jgi:hypothetical protein